MVVEEEEEDGGGGAADGLGFIYFSRGYEVTRYDLESV